MTTSRAAALAIAVLSTGCLRETSVGTLDAGQSVDTLTITGSACTTARSRVDFPLKVMFVVDQSGSMCITDPPSSQPTSSFCDTAGLAPPGVTVPARVRLLQRAVAELRTNPAASVGLVTYSSAAKKEFPSQTSTSVFAPPDAALDALVSSLQFTLGRASDLQGALAMATTLIRSDIDMIKRREPNQLARTRYVVVLITDGAPYPRCSSNDALPAWASSADPDGIWPDSDSNWCNTIAPTDPDYITGFTAGGDRNQTAQLTAPLDDLSVYATANRVGAIKIQSLLLTNADTFASCGAICQDLLPADAARSDRVEANRIASHWLLAEFNKHLAGDVRDFQNQAGVTSAANATLDFTTLFSPSVLRGLFVQPLKAVRVGGLWEPDADGDGLPDSIEAAVGTTSNSLLADSDGDGFSDWFEETHRAELFNPLVKDSRGCDPAVPATLNCVVRDSDGDGLSQFEENYLGTSDLVVDSDGDSIPDGLEVRAGLDPATPNLGDLDSDLVTDFGEVQLGTDPTKPGQPQDNPARLRLSSTVSEDRGDTVCYQLTLAGLPMQAPEGAPAFYKIWVGDGPSAVSRDEGNWSVACARAIRDDKGQSPEDLNLPGLDGSYFHTPTALVEPTSKANWCLTPTGFDQR